MEAGPDQQYFLRTLKYFLYEAEYGVFRASWRLLDYVLHYQLKHLNQYSFLVKVWVFTVIEESKKSGIWFSFCCSRIIAISVQYITVLCKLKVFTGNNFTAVVGAWSIP